VGKYFLNHCRVFDAGNGPDVTTALFKVSTLYRTQPLMLGPLLAVSGSKQLHQVDFRFRAQSRHSESIIS